MKFSASDFLEMWRDSLTSVGRSGTGLSLMLFDDAAGAGIAEDELRQAAGGDLESYLAMHHTCARPSP